MSLGYEKAAEIGRSPDRAYSLGDVVQVMGQVRHAMESVIEGKRSSIDLALVVLLAEGHLLVEDVPGVGKTMLAKAWAARSRAQYAEFSSPRTCCHQTSPASRCSIRKRATSNSSLAASSPTSWSVTRSTVHRRRRSRPSWSRWRNVKSASMARPIGSSRRSWWSPPRTRSRWKAPTRCQRRSETGSWRGSRWAIRLPNSELDMLESHGSSDPLAALQPVTDGSTIRGLIEAVKKVYVSPAVKHYIVQIVNATRNSRDLRLGASPRATLQLLRASRAFAAMSGRDYVTPDDVAALGVSVLAHRVLPSTDAQLARRTVTDVIAQAIQSVHIPDRR